MKVQSDTKKSVAFISFSEIAPLSIYDELAVEKIIKQIIEVYKGGYRTFYTRLEQGFDLIATYTLITLRNKGTFRKPIDIIAYGASPTYRNKLDKEYKALYDYVIENVDHVSFAGKALKKTIITERNRCVYNASSLILSYYDDQLFNMETFLSAFLNGKTGHMRLIDISRGTLYQF